MTYSHKLFGAFQRLHTTEKFMGTGIGLATVRRVINRHGGKIWAQAAVGQVATFFSSLAQR
jgi:two-component system sensor histidine kinase/response regulator